MTPNEYQKLAMSTSVEHDNYRDRLVNAALGLSGEAGEVSDIIKKHAFHGTGLQETELRKELGDVLWYVAQACDALGVQMKTIMQENIDKLAKRWPEKFKKGDEAHTNSRKLET